MTETGEALSDWKPRMESQYLARSTVMPPKTGKAYKQSLSFLETKPEKWTEKDFPWSNGVWQMGLSYDRLMSDEEFRSAYLDLGHLLKRHRESRLFEEKRHLLI
ncbi:hypothetical protein FRC03_007211 [Tulasnella sp. 419]|nr:hypothetical protein FRC03_007211 [Tulasnella sp. 419]